MTTTGAEQAKADAARLARIERGIHTGPRTSNDDAIFLLTLARRALAAEEAIQTFLRDREADEGAQARRDVLLRDEAGRMAARECVEIAARVLRERGSCYDGGFIELAIREQFALDAGTPTLSQQVARECAEIAAEGVDVHRRICERFGLPNAIDPRRTPATVEQAQEAWASMVAANPSGCSVCHDPNCQEPGGQH